MEKIEKYVVFKYEDEFGFHYMVMDELPGGDPYTRRPYRSRRRSTPPVLRELSLVSRFRRTENPLMCSAPNSSPWRVGGQIRATFWSGRKGSGFTEPPRNWRRKKKTSSSRKPLSLYEKHTVVSVQAGGVRLLLKWSTFSLSRQFALRSLKKFSYGEKIDYVYDTNKRIRQCLSISEN